MDEVKKLELAIELAKVEALERLRVAVENSGKDQSHVLKALRGSAGSGASGLVREALQKVEALLSGKQPEAEPETPPAPRIANPDPGGLKAATRAIKRHQQKP